MYEEAQPVEGNTAQYSPFKIIRFPFRTQRSRILSKTKEFVRAVCTFCPFFSVSLCIMGRNLKLPLSWFIENFKIPASRTIILPVVLYGCKTWSLTLREERKLRVFESMVLRRIFGPRRDEVTGEWRRLHNEELNDLYSSPNIVWVIKSRRMRWAGHVARMGEERGCIGSWWGNRRKRDHWGDLGIDVWIILGRISRRWDVGIWTGLGWPKIETVGGRLWVR